MNTVSSPLAAQQSLLLVTPENKAAFAQNFEQTPFVLQHGLASHPLFQLEHLLGLVRKTAHQPERLFFNTGDATIGGGWDFHGTREFPAEEALKRIETANAWMILKSVQAEPEYAAVLEAFLAEIYHASGRELSATHNHVMSIILTSPNRVTPYHMDGESNYLLQLSGSKSLYVFNGRDRSVVTEQELERFWSGDLNAATYREETQAGAWHFAMEPGIGVHVPTTFPHWVKNGSDVSISVSLNVQFKDERIPQLYRINGALRRRGLHPRAPGTAPFSDRLKLAGSRLKSLV